MLQANIKQKNIKIKKYLGSLFGDEKRNVRHNKNFQALRPSCSLSMLNQKNLRVVRSSKSTENLHKIQQIKSNSQYQTNLKFVYNLNLEIQIGKILILPHPHVMCRAVIRIKKVPILAELLLGKNLLVIVLQIFSTIYAPKSLFNI